MKGPAFRSHFTHCFILICHSERSEESPYFFDCLALSSFLTALRSSKKAYEKHRPAGIRGILRFAQNDSSIGDPKSKRWDLTEVKSHPVVEAVEI